MFVIGISNWLYRISYGWVALLALAVFLLFTILVLPGQAASAENNSGGTGSPDMSFFYSPQDLFRMAEAYGVQGRQAYLRARWTFDLVWPIVYTVFLSTVLSWLLTRALSETSRWLPLNLFPLLGMLFDYLENSATSLVMLRYPQPAPIAAGLAPIFTSLKWVFVGGSFVLLVLAALGAIWRRLSKRGG